MNLTFTNFKKDISGKLFLGVLSILFFANLIPLFSQALPDSTVIKPKADSVCWKLSFLRGDTLTYSVTSLDSIVINFGTPLLKSRNELLEVVCDSVSAKGTFFLTLELLDFVGFESSGDEKNVEHKGSPWVGRKIQLEIDTLGNRLSLNIDDSTLGGVSPGGAFQPYLFFPFKENCKKLEETWLVNTTETLPENAIPPPVLRQSSLFRARASVDTLGEKCTAFEFIRTGQGSLRIKSDNINVFTSSIINGFGIYYISIEKHIPVYFYYSVEQKLNIETSETGKQPGWHYITSMFTLNQYKHMDPEALKKNFAKPIPKKYIKKRK